jgi:zinc resistance-associated protein
MLKKVAMGATALTLLVSAIAYAQQPPARPDGGPRMQFSAEDRAAFLDARVAALHAGLKLTPDQEKSWSAFEQAYRDLAAQRAKRMAERRVEPQAADPVQRAQRAADALAARSVALKHYADATAPLYQSLDDGQKRRFGMLSRSHRPHFHRFAMWGQERGERDNFRAFR